MEKVLVDLVRLQDLDRSIARLSARIGGLPTEIREKEQVAEALEATASKMDEERKTLLVKADGLEVDLSVDELRIQKLEAQSREARDASSVQIAQHEAEALRTRVSEAQDQALACMDEAETLATSKEATLLEASQAQEVVIEFRSQAGEDEVELLQELEARQGQRAEVAARVGADTLHRYQALYEPRKGRPVARMAEGACEGCGMAIQPNDQGKVRVGKRVMTCPSCSRILVDAAFWARAKE